MKRKRFIEEQIIAVLREHWQVRRSGIWPIPRRVQSTTLTFLAEICSRLSAAMPIAKVAEACATRKQHC
jgi:hypothetical protein